MESAKEENMTDLSGLLGSSRTAEVRRDSQTHMLLLLPDGSKAIWGPFCSLSYVNEMPLPSLNLAFHDASLRSSRRSSHSNHSNLPPVASYFPSSSLPQALAPSFIRA